MPNHQLADRTRKPSEYRGTVERTHRWCCSAPLGSDYPKPVKKAKIRKVTALLDVHQLQSTKACLKQKSPSIRQQKHLASCFRGNLPLWGHVETDGTDNNCSDWRKISFLNIRKLWRKTPVWEIQADVFRKAHMAFHITGGKWRDKVYTELNKCVSQTSQRATNERGRLTLCVKDRWMNRYTLITRCPLVW